MKRPYALLNIVLLAGLVWLTGCKKDEDDPNQPVMQLSTDKVAGKSGQDIAVTVSMTMPGGFKDLVITKGINLQPDTDFGSQSVTASSTGSNTYEYLFNYTLSPDETDKLVGFNFRLTDNQGRAVEKDLTVNTTPGPAQIMFTRTWLLTSKFWESVGAEDIKDCEKDDVYTFKRDSTMSYGYGSSACSLDGLNIYDHWEISEDEKTVTLEYYNIFNPAQRTIEQYNVRSITTEKIVMDITVDLSWLGFSDKEKFIYTLEAR
ncbi:MAG: lipocalin family protein [Candidatus Pseudobacter hemicellulosilyticus]|uniref:Lipocalin family protein n=1 Tax=Candidatus Pseudobacter hemicellulosilyticus TaxID=3121375 RepID=A0AAJ5WP78_9BACT|nr:MAG: lipocalin family protein [Pseudobacter sp.]